MIIVVLAVLSCVACTASIQEDETTNFEAWDDVVEAGENKAVTILMWGGNDMINTYMDDTIAKALKIQHGITLNRVPMNAPEYINKLINEKNGDQTKGNADLIWINAENFRTATQGSLLWGPFTDLLPNMAAYYDQSAADLNTDTGILINNMEAIWGRAQLVLTTDSNRVSEPPKSYKALLMWAKENPGRFSYPQLPDDFVGSAFVRGAIYELTNEKDFNKDYTKAEFKAIMMPVLDYFEELHPYLWREGSAFPTSQAQLDELFLNGEVDFTIGFELGKTAGLVSSGIYPSTAYSFIFDTGTLGNAHYLAVPFNAPQKAAALLTINVLQDPKFQLEKFKPSVWGDMPAFDATKISEENKNSLANIENNVFSISLNEVYKRRLPELRAQYIDWVEMNWINRFAQ